MRSKSGRVLGALLVSFGVLLGVITFGLIAWGDLEAFLFDPSVGSNEPLRTLRCPVMIASDEVGQVRATFHNPTERAVERPVRAHITEGYVTLFREVSTQLPLEPGETRQLTWEVTVDDAAYGRFILVRVHVLRQGPLLPSRTASCGVLVADFLGLPGGVIVALALAASLLCLGLGGFLWAWANHPLGGRALELMQGMVSIAVVVLAGIIMSLLGWWLGAFFLFVLVLLLVVVLVARFVFAV